MFNSYISEERQKEINIELDFILKDPNWSEYIFWTEDYIKEDGNIDFPKFFEKNIRTLDSTCA